MIKMCRITTLAAAALSLLWVPTTSAVYIDHKSPLRAGDLDSSRNCAGWALDWLAGCHIPHDCIGDVACQASAFCHDYVHPSQTKSTIFNTVVITSTTTGTATRTLTSQATTTSTSSSTTTTTSTETSTTTTLTTSTFTAATSYVPPTPTTTPVVVKARDYQDPDSYLQKHCPKLSTARLKARPSSHLSYACSCLGFHLSTKIITKSIATTTTTTATKSTTTSTTTTQTTTTTTTPVTVTTTTTTTSATTTSSSVVTTTAIIDYCSITYNGGGVTPGNTVVSPPGDLSGPECCALCWQTPNCVASAMGLGYCQLLIKTSPLGATPTIPQCPLGIENYTYLEGPGTLYRGPCSPGLN